MVVAQGGDGAQVDDPTLLPQAPFVIDIVADRAGTIAAMDTGELGWTAVRLGGGRQQKGDRINHAVGFVLPFKIGDKVNIGETLGAVHAASAAAGEQAAAEILAAITLSEEPVSATAAFLWRRPITG